jgi:hypothetical protein
MIASLDKPWRTHLSEPWVEPAQPGDWGWDMTPRLHALLKELGMDGDDVSWYDCTSGDMCFGSEDDMARFRVAVDTRAAAPCPFCGGAAVLGYADKGFLDRDYAEVRVSCSGSASEARPPVHPADAPCLTTVTVVVRGVDLEKCRAEAVTRWNTRKPVEG